ncbi:MAG: DUF3575 domain-containing protein [Bacteroidales bacterium]|nr:DUF3575 domain-containing protein [Bacteroidales bacterium]MBQ2492321.1 DUF3575 domain-containing protein [Bacteroidales bacterium]MBQ4197442.1 DUF3575 domain-containing protein [Bacteroidales bacterium]
MVALRYKFAGAVAALVLVLCSGVALCASSVDEKVNISKDTDTTRRHGASIRTNLFYAGSGTPNLGLEIPVSKHVSLGGNFGLKPWPRFLAWDNDKMKEKKWKHLLAVPELRIWPKEVYEKWFFGLDLVYTHYNVAAVKFPFGMYKKAKNSRLEGDWLGIGLFLGRSWWLNDRWRLELEAGAAVGKNNAKQYECGYCGTEIGKDKSWGVVPKLGLNLAYNFVKRQTAEEVIQTVTIPEPQKPKEVTPPNIVPPVLKTVTPKKGVADELALTNSFLKPISEYKPYTPDRILRKEKELLYVNFEVGKHILKYNFRNNAEILDKIIDVTGTVMRDARHQMAKMQIIGLASVEGSNANNIKLSNNRALALKLYIQDKLNIPDDLFDLYGGGEAWSEFKDQINDLILAGGGDNLSKTELEQVMNIINTEENLDRREARIKALNGRRTYPKILKALLADQRNSGYLTIYYDYVDDTAKAINTSIDLLEAGKNEEALKLIEAQKEDPRSYNTLAAALFLNGREAEAVQYLEKAIARGGEDAAAAKENLAAIKKYQADRAEYEKYKKEVEEYNKKMEEYNRQVQQLKQSR